MSLPQRLQVPSSQSHEVTRADVAHLHANDIPSSVAPVIDVRSKTEVQQLGKMPHSHNIPIDEIEKAFALSPEDFEAKYKFPMPKKNTPIVVHCQIGGRAATAQAFLYKIGYTHAKLYKGSYQEWSTPPLQRLRKKIMVPFGKATGADNSNSVAIEHSSAIQLGKVDPVEKAAVDEITSFMQSSLQIAVVSPTAKRMRAKAAEEEAKAKAAAAAAKASPAAVASSSAATGPDGEKKALSWGEARRLKQDAANDGGRQGRDSGAKDGGAPKSTKRTASGNQVDPLVVRVRNLAEVTANELNRIFGPENGLGKIARVYVAPVEKGMAYITYKSEIDAAQAIAKMDKKRFKHCILQVDHGTVRQKK